MRKHPFCVFLLPSLFLLLWSPQFAQAASSLFITPASGTYESGELFNVLVNLNSGGRAVNAATGELQYDTSKLEIQSVGYSRSVFTLWTEEPSYSNSTGKLRFSGGVPSPGFSGSSGAIVRITFRTKSPGTVPVLITSGSVLANDGLGTNIAEALTGAVFTITGGSGSSLGAAASSSAAVETEEHTIDLGAPVVTDYPRELQDGDPLIVRGLAFPGATVVLYAQKGNDEPIVHELVAGPDGKFTFTMEGGAVAGFYRVWARTVNLEGVAGGSSEPVFIEVLRPLFFRVGSVALTYTSIIIILFALLFSGFFVIGWMWRSMRQWQIKRGKEVSEAEQALHEGFDSLRKGLDDYLSYLRNGKSPQTIKRREAKTRSEVKRGIDEIERRIEKEIEDIKE